MLRLPKRLRKSLGKSRSRSWSGPALFSASTPVEIDTAFAAIAGVRADALFVAPDAFFTGRPSHAVCRARCARQTLRKRLFDDMFRQVGVYSGTILKGAKPAELPVLQSTKFEFTINLKTARLLGLDIPPMLLARADEIIE
jgi:putative ABC transport system substrate-binding protein